MRGKVHILVYCPIDTLQWGPTHSGLVDNNLKAISYVQTISLIIILLSIAQITMSDTHLFLKHQSSASFKKGSI